MQILPSRVLTTLALVLSAPFLHGDEKSDIRQVSINFKVLETPLGLIDQILIHTQKDDSEKTFTPVLSRPRAREVYQALLASPDAELLYLPSIVVLDGQPTRLSSGKELIYPTDFAIPLESNQSSPSQPTPRFDTVAPDDEQPGFRKVGLVIDLTPRIDKNHGISLELVPKLTRLVNFEEYGQGIKVPVFWSWSVNTVINLGVKESLVLRGPSSEAKKEILFFIEPSISP
jgi:type II secretory pathway component GspD/PulD (secretin)